MIMSQKQKIEQAPATAAPAPSEQAEKTAPQNVPNLPQNAPAGPQNPAETESQNHDLASNSPVLPPEIQIDG